MAIPIRLSRHWALTARVAVATVGGYAFTWGFVALVTSTLFLAGLDFHDAETLALLSAFLVYLGLFLWAFVAPSLVRVGTVFAMGAILMTGAAWGLQQTILG
ncbi:hypothetical protein T5B8_05606 [Salinisphaera sp. T5B8]|uniref:iron uptake protein n=1 Tax=Salinisphaera sp. T5B8 TaxID=1304154 RepID=UPI0033428044